MILEAWLKIMGISNSEDINRMISAEARKTAQQGDSDSNRLRGAINQLNSIKNMQESPNMPQSAKDSVSAMKFVSGELSKMSSSLKGILTKSFDVVTSIYKILKKNSPLLEAVENLFNIAMQLFFMPLGNKLGEMLIPAVIELLDNVVKMWDELGDGRLGDMFGKAITNGINYLAKFFQDIGKTLEKEGGLIGSVGLVLSGISTFLANKGADLINLVFNLSSFIISHLGTIITLIGSFMALHYALQFATMSVIVAAQSTPWAIALGTAAVVTAAGGIGLSAYLGGHFAMAEGGYVPATEGGSLHLLGEGGEGEYVIPESKLGTMGGNSYIINISGITTDELKTMIKDVISGEISQSRLRSGF